MFGLTDLAALLGPVSVSVTLIILGRLSHKLGKVTHAKPYYYGFYIAALLVGVSIIVQLLYLVQNNAEWNILYNGLFALGVTIGLVIAWRYWSWLLAERG